MNIYTNTNEYMPKQRKKNTQAQKHTHPRDKKGKKEIDPHQIQESGSTD